MTVISDMSSIERKKISTLIPDPHNANKGTERGLRMLDDSIALTGLGRSIVTDCNGTVIAGNKTLDRAHDRGFEDAVVVHTTGNELVVVQRDDLDLNSNDPNNPARKLAFFDNRTSELSLDWDAEQLLADVNAGMDLSALFNEHELDELLAPLHQDDIDRDAKPNLRNLPLDIIYTIQNADCTCCLAVQAGLKYGIQSAHYLLCPYTDLLSSRHKIAFIDNDYFNYDHEIHRRAVMQHRPKYATVRDVMSEKQCLEEHIEYFSFEQILDWAEELTEYAQNVIVIPKYDCLDQIPEKFILGYSIPTSHGGTPLPPKSFKGRKVHLLGGSWKAQLEYLAILGEDVVSLDNNYIQRQATLLGAACDPEGKEYQLKDLGLGYLTNVRYVALALSFGSIGAKLNELYPQTVEVPV